MPLLQLEHSMNARRSEGGTATERTKEQLVWFEAYLKELVL